MPTQPIPFSPTQQSGLESLAGSSPQAINVVLEPNGVVRRRPGIAAYSTGTVDADGVVGIHATVSGRVYVVGDTDDARTIYRMTGGAAAVISSGSTGYLNGSLRPVFAETEAMVAIAGGNDIGRIYLDGDQTGRLSSDAPRASHVVSNNSRLLANDIEVTKSSIAYSSAGAGSATSPHEEWTISAATTAGAVTAEARPDPVVALAEGTTEVFAFGSTSVQVYGPDPSLDYAPVGTREFGCIAPYSVVKVDGTFFWLDHLRRFVRSDGRSFEDIGTEVKATLDAMATVSDCFGYRIIVGGIDVVCWCFPTDGRTFAYQPGGGWSTWMGWNDSAANFKRLVINAACVNPATGQVLVGTTAGRVGKMSRTTVTDLGEPIVVSVTTGYLSRGTDARKHCKSVLLVFRRGETTTSGEAVALLSWRDDGGPWNPSMQIGMGASGDTDPVVQLRSLGVYRRREWKLEFAGAGDFILAAATEDFEVLE